MIELLDLKTELLIALDLEQTFWRTFLTNANLFPHTLDLINLLKSKKIPIAIVTDLTAHIQLRKLTYFGLHDIFDAVVTSEEAGLDKPDPSIFNLTLRKLKINSYDNVWMVGDNFLNVELRISSNNISKLVKGLYLARYNLPDLLLQVLKIFINSV